MLTSLKTFEEDSIKIEDGTVHPERMRECDSNVNKLNKFSSCTNIPSTVSGSSLPPPDAL